MPANGRFTRNLKIFCYFFKNILAKKDNFNDYAASIEGICIPNKWVQAAVNFPLEASGSKVAGFDVADEGGDANALCLRHGPVVKKVEA